MRQNLRKSDVPMPEIFDAPTTLEQWEIIDRDANKNLISDKIYRGETTQNRTTVHTVRALLTELYYNKCAYCENDEFAPDVEHYRPCKKVTGERHHKGYYWLCYEWSNLLPACSDCNSNRGKWNKFPIQGVRVENPDFIDGRLDKSRCKANQAPLIDENPFLLHPEIDNPKLFFKFYENGIIEGVDEAERGEQTIRICDLNRDILKTQRQRIIIDETKRWIERTLLFFSRDFITANTAQRYLFSIFDDMKARQLPEKPFSLMAEYVFEHFKEIISPLWNNPIRENLELAYDAYRQENP